jgi:hypothetical protein
MRNGAMSLGRSINTVMTPVFNIITYEKVSTHAFSCVSKLALTKSSPFGQKFSDVPSSQLPICFLD